MAKALQFTKMHGLGNDYVYIDCFRHPLNGVDRPALSRAISDRHRGVGSDGLILICPPDGGAGAGCRMEMYNADGSRGEMCGNGIRCVAKYVVEHGLLPQGAAGKEAMNRSAESTDRSRETKPLCVQTDRGVLHLVAFLRAGRVHSVRVDMGLPILKPADIPVAMNEIRCVAQPLLIGDRRLTMTCVSMGNPHAVFFVEDFAHIDLPMMGPLIERHELFPNRINVHVAVVQSRQEATMKTWERGSGLTQACGTGACAVLVAGVLEGRLDPRATLHLPGGDLDVEWPDAPGGPVFMTGPAEEVFSGEWRITNGE